MFHRGAYAAGSDSTWNIRSAGVRANTASTTLEVRKETQLVIQVAASVTEGLAYRVNGGWSADAELQCAGIPPNGSRRLQFAVG